LTSKSCQFVVSIRFSPFHDLEAKLLELVQVMKQSLFITNSQDTKMGMILLWIVESTTSHESCMCGLGKTLLNPQITTSDYVEISWTVVLGAVHNGLAFCPNWA